MPYNSPLSAVSVWITFSVQIACGYVLTRILSALFRTHQLRLRLWTIFLLLTVSGWIFVSAPIPAGSSIEVPTLATQQSSAQHFSWPVSDSWVRDLDRMGAWTGWIYLSVVAILLLQLLAKRLRLNLTLRNRQAPSAELLVIFGTLCREMQVRRCQLSLLAHLRSPATTGWFRPHVLLPMELVPRLTPDELGQILRHELIHVKRRDYFWDRLAALGCRILFFHPAVWLAYRRMRWERELACDQAVVENSLDSRLTYAECLTGLARWWFIAERSSSSGIGFSSSSSLLATRIRELLREPRRVSIFEKGLRTGLITAMFFVGIVFLPSVALTLYRSGSLIGPSRLPNAILVSSSRPRDVRKGSPPEIRRDVALQTRGGPVGVEVQDPTLRMLLSSGSAPIPILQSGPGRTSGEGVDKTVAGQSAGVHGAEPSAERGPWDESSTPQSGSAATILRQAAADAISIGMANAGGGGQSTGGESSGGDQGNQQGNHLQ
jgi:beta-lactamase regulating signal transducer with metallopeptidase domain